MTSGSHGVFRRRLAPLAQLDRASDFESAGRRFESSGARHIESRFRLRRRRGRPNGPAFSAAIGTEIPEVRASFAGSASTGDEPPAAPHEPSLPGRLAPCLSPSASGGCSPTRGVTVRPRVLALLRARGSLTRGARVLGAAEPNKRTTHSTHLRLRALRPHEGPPVTAQPRCARR